MYKKKYLKYKNKYILFKNQIGGVFNNLSYLGEGAESIVFKMETGTALKIVKNTKKFISDNEKEIISKLTELRTLNFPTFHAIATCKSDTAPDKDTREFCISGSTGKLYQYIIMDTINGNDMMNIFFDIFKDHVSKEVFNADD
jgi:hypothetical protein